MCNVIVRVSFASIRVGCKCWNRYIGCDQPELIPMGFSLYQESVGEPKEPSKEPMELVEPV